MNRQQKEQMVESLRDSFAQSSSSFLVDYRGLSVAQLQSLRADLRKSGGKLQVTKARLMKRAAEGLEGAQEMTPFFKNQVALVFAKDEPPVVAKSLHTFAQENESLKIVAGCLDQQLLDESGVIRMASLPSKEVLLAKLLGTLQAPIQQCVTVLNMNTMKLLWALKKVGEQKK